MLQKPVVRVSAALAVAFVIFIVLGLPDGILGTLWPTQRTDMRLAVGDLSWVIVGLTVGYTSGSVLSGHVTGRFGVSTGMLVAFAGSLVGLVGYGLAPNLSGLVVISAVAGAGAGLLDPIVNSWVSLRHSARAMGFLHAFFGLGAAIGPPFATAAITNGLTWRTVFVMVGLAQLGLMALVWWKRADYDSGELHPKHGDEAARTQPAVNRLLVLTMLWFFLVVGLEVSVSSWAFSLLFEERGVGETNAALWMAIFWGTFTAGRVVLGIVGDRLSGEAALWASVAISAVGAALMWVDPDGLPAGISLPILGAGISLLFPVMVLMTPRWLGPERAAVATGYQFGAASVGAVFFAIVIGRLADAASLEVLGPVLVAASAAAALLLFVMRTEAARSVPEGIGLG